MESSGHLVLLFVLQLPFVALAGDPDILTDFVVPLGSNPAQLDGRFFTYTNLMKVLDTADMTKFAVSKAGKAEFPALDGQSVSSAALMYGAGTVNPPHIHPRASELLYVVQGPLFVGLVNANSTLYTQTLETGDMFVFPKGLVHFQFNNGSDMARAVSAFGSASPGTISLPASLFGAGIDDAVLEKALRTDEATVEVLKHGLEPPAEGPAQPPAQPPPAQSSATVAFGAALVSRSVLAVLCFAAALL